MNSKNKKRNDLLLIVGGIALALLGYFLIMYLINDLAINPVWFTLLFAYVALVYPQKLALDYLKGYQYIDDEDLDIEDYRADNSNWIMFVQDFKLMKYFGNDALWQKVINVILGVSIPFMVFSIAYVNFLVAFWDLGATFAWVMIYGMFISTAIFLLTKSVILGYFIYMFTGNYLLVLTAIIYPLGAFVIFLYVKKAFLEYDEYALQDALGEDYN